MAEPVLQENEKVTIGYNPVVVRRLLRYLKPYRIMVVFALVALSLSTASELLLPIVLQRAVDRHLVAVWRRAPLDRVAEHAPLRDAVERSGTVIGPWAYVLEVDLKEIPAGVQRALREQDLLSEEQYWVTPVDHPETAAAVDANPERIERSQTHAAIPADVARGLDAPTRLALRAHDLRGITRLAAVFLSLLVTVLFTAFIQVYLMASVGQGVMKDMRLQLFDHTLHQSLSFLNGHPVGKLVTRLTNDVETINELFTNVVVNLLKNFAIMAGVIVTMFLLSPRMAAVTIATLPPVLFFTLVFRKKARDAFREVRRWVSRVNAFIAEHVSGMPVVQMFVREVQVGREFARNNDKLMQASLSEMYVFAVFRPIVDLLSSVSLAIIVFMGAQFLSLGVVSLGILIAFIDLAKRFYQQLMDISDRFVILQSAMAGSERVFELLDAVDRMEDRGALTLAQPVLGRVEFETVSFAYRAGEPVLRDLSFTVEPGQSVAIVGYTGAGKTTIANLVTRLWDADRGTIRLDGANIRDIPLAELRATVQPIAQDVFLFSETVAENIRLGADISDERVREAARTVQADSFIRALPNGYETVLEEGATNISTGQRQLIAFARVLAHDPRVIILDEATANIDTETERLIQAGISTLLAGRTSLVIAHRLSTIKHADRILVLSGGELVEQGSHEELLAARGLYANLYRLQYEP
ncbi:MAG: ABC transporter ATP-binding protein [Spirochaetaceae bacterium]|nr:MAG: ABC transporter ATP-binding protein [Spirochaetaceae bacterium]